MTTNIVYVDIFLNYSSNVDEQLHVYANYVQMFSFDHVIPYKVRNKRSLVAHLCMSFKGEWAKVVAIFSVRNCLF